MAYLTRGNYKKAIEYCNQHLVIAKEMGNNAMEGVLYGLLGLIFFILGDLETAIDYCNQKVRVIPARTGKQDQGKDASVFSASRYLRQSGQ